VLEGIAARTADKPVDTATTGQPTSEGDEEEPAVMAV
jgi:hypothetical protein